MDLNFLWEQAQACFKPSVEPPPDAAELDSEGTGIHL